MPLNCFIRAIDSIPKKGEKYRQTTTKIVTTTIKYVQFESCSLHYTFICTFQIQVLFASHSFEKKKQSIDSVTFQSLVMQEFSKKISHIFVFFLLSVNVSISFTIANLFAMQFTEVSYYKIEKKNKNKTSLSKMVFASIAIKL